jgi:hypothetical protein
MTVSAETTARERNSASSHFFGGEREEGEGIFGVPLRLYLVLTDCISLLFILVFFLPLINYGFSSRLYYLGYSLLVSEFSLS